MLRRSALLIASVVSLVVSITGAAYSQNSPLLLFDGKTGRFFAGCLNCNKFDDAAVCNKFGDYGSKFSDLSIWNKFGKFGSKFEDQSPWNKFGDGLRIVDPDGNYYGLFTASNIDRSRLQIVNALIAAFERTDNLEAIRDLFCGD